MTSACSAAAGEADNGAPAVNPRSEEHTSELQSRTDWPEGLTAVRAAGFSLVALTPASTALDIREFALDEHRPAHVALVAGTEGAGLSAAVERLADHRVRIPMAPGADSLNLATATGIALQRLRE